MADPAVLHNSQVAEAKPELWTAEILDSATAVGEQVRCIIDSKDPDAGTDEMRWKPVVLPGGFFFPKRGDAALVAMPPDGPPWIVAWEPAPTAEPDAPLP